MKKEDLFEIFDDINNQYVKEAHMKNERKNTFTWTKWGIMAACLALLLFVSIPMINGFPPAVDDNTPDVEASQDANCNLTEDFGLQKEMQQSSIETFSDDKEESQNAESEAPNISDMSVTESQENTGELISSDEMLGGSYPNEAGQSEENIVEDVPADSNGEYNEAVNSSDLTKDTSKFFGGSYTDSNGNFVIVLTEDTPENRTAICKELGRNENNTTFVSGTYTLEYLTELQTKISNAMVNREIPFVVSSALSETTNNIVIRSTTNDEAELAKVYALDTIGGAIQVEYTNSTAVKDVEALIAPKAE